MVAPCQQLELAHRGGFAVELLTALRVYQTIVGAGQDQERDPDFADTIEDVFRRRLPFGVQAARDSRVYQRVAAVGLDHLGYARNETWIDLVVQRQPGHHAGRCVSETDLPCRNGDLPPKCGA